MALEKVPVAPYFSSKWHSFGFFVMDNDEKW
jgi:hypothetical protein